MVRYVVVVLVTMIIVTTTQGFSWGRVFNNEEVNNRNQEEEGTGRKGKMPQEGHGLARHEAEAAEKRVPERVHDTQEKSLRAVRGAEAHDEGKRVSGYEENRLVEGHPEERSRNGEAISVMSGMGTIKTNVKQKDGDSDLRSLQKEVLEMDKPLGPGTEAEKVEVVGVPREREHHITDGLADAIAGLMGVYNSLVRADGREWDSSIHGSVDGTGGERSGARNKDSTMEEETSVRASGKERERRGGWGALTVLAGIVIIAGVCVLLVGFGQRERECAVYPPRGPAYV